MEPVELHVMKQGKFSRNLLRLTGLTQERVLLAVFVRSSWPNAVPATANAIASDKAFVAQAGVARVCNHFTVNVWDITGQAPWGDPRVVRQQAVRVAAEVQPPAQLDRVRDHRAELEHRERDAVPAGSLLAEDDRAARLEHDPRARGIEAHPIKWSLVDHCATQAWHDRRDRAAGSGLRGTARSG